MSVIEDKGFVNEVVDIDGKFFRRCSFINCSFVYSGAEGSGLQDCGFTPNPHLTLTGLAYRTALLLDTFGMLREGLIAELGKPSSNAKH